ncbi:MAG: class I SAM-dependent RNA methyltransferase, partial [Terriglobales bacterium]
AWGWSENQDFFYATAGARFRVSPGAFFQANRFLLDELVQSVAAGRVGSLALDLYSGVGLFAAALARSFKKVIAVESSRQSFSDLEHNSPVNVQPVRATAAEFLEKRAKKLSPGLVVVDPPREGLGDKVTRALAVLAAPRLTCVSCDPATLSRDLRGLLESGYRVEEVHLVDLFPQTFHFESMIQLVR